MEQLKHINWPIVIGGTVIASLLFVLWRTYRLNTLKEKYYRAALSGDYDEILKFMLLAMLDKHLPKKVLDKIYFDYSRFLERGLKKYFDSRLNLRVNSSRVTRIRDFFVTAEDTIKSITPQLEHAKIVSEQYWKPISAALEETMLECGSGYFAGCYVESIANQDKSEGRVQRFILDIYSDWANSSDEAKNEKARLFVELVNKEIEKHMDYNIPQEKKDVLHIGRLSINKKANTTETVFIAPQMY